MILWVAAAAVLTALASASRGPAAGGRRAPARPSLAALAALGTGLAIVLAPVALRNYAVAGEVALVSSHGGLNFYIGNNPGADGTYRPVAGVTPSIAGQDRDMRAVAERATGRPQSDTQASSWFFAQAWHWIASNPGAAAALFARKCAYVFNAADVPLNDSYAFYATDVSWLLRLLAVGPWLLLPLGVSGLWFGRPGAGSAEARGAWWRFAAFIPVYALSVAVFFVTGRYRLPILVACAVTACGSLMALGRCVRERRWRELGIVLAAVGAIGLATNVGLGLDNGLAAWRTEMILHDIAAGEDAAAEALLGRTEPMHPNRSLLLYRAGRAWLARGDATRALAVLQRARPLAPERREIELEIGQALLALGRAAEAVPHLRAARDLPGREDEARVALARAEMLEGHPEAALAEIASLRSPETLAAGAQAAVGRLAMEAGQPRAAEPFLARAVNLAPADPELREAYALSLASSGKVGEAITALEAACRLDSANPGLRMNLAILYAAGGRFADARQQATEVLAMRPGDPRAREFLASLPGGR